MSDWTAYPFATTSAIPSGFWRWPHFSPTELIDRVDGSLVVVPAFLDLLESLRAQVGFPLPISSAYRTPAHNVEVSSTKSPTGAHTLGLAVDLAIAGSEPRAYQVLKSAFALGFPGIEACGDHLHLDCAPSQPNAPRPYFWVSP
jgi:hypothetical protein